jgi:hypothetical protein
MALTVVWNEYNGTDTWGTPTHVNILLRVPWMMPILL